MKFDKTLEIKRAMAIYAHPDDAEFGMAGTVAKWVKAGVEFTYCMVTNGASGSDDPKMTREKLRDTRYAEQRAAAKILGVKNVVFLGHEDGYLYPTLEVRRDVARQIRIHKPDVILTMDPTSRINDGYVNHPDHIAAGEVVLRSINPDASTRNMFPELWFDEHLEPHKPSALFLTSFSDDGTFIDISDVMETKVKALLAHSSQLWPGAEDMIRGWAKATGKAAGYKAAEAYRVVRFDEPPTPPRRRRATAKRSEGRAARTRATRSGAVSRTRAAGRTRASASGKRGVQRDARMSTRRPMKRTPSRTKRAR
ncbi:MAG TPA: PIG-L deacetylase family protein [Candidatus Limnocylindrales bacterium]|nr:PIG-L deacetylase family protein [Candidatus Limnocylindrales bacterium]